MFQQWPETVAHFMGRGRIFKIQYGLSTIHVVGHSLLVLLILLQEERRRRQAEAAMKRQKEVMNYCVWP